MLVLTRTENQQIHIGDNIIVNILEIEDQKIKIGITAPRDMLILRSELKQRSLKNTFNYLPE